MSYWELNSWLPKKCLGNRPLEEKVNMHLDLVGLGLNECMLVGDFLIHSCCNFLQLNEVLYKGGS